MTSREHINVACVYGDDHVRHLEQILIPALTTAASSPIRFFCMNYDGESLVRVNSRARDGLTITDIPNSRKTQCGFAQCHNAIFRASSPEGFFVILNPDTIPQATSIDLLIARYQRTLKPAGIVEGRQWPFDHPKEFDPLTLETPWASGAFSLIDVGFFQRVGGMDETYFLYMEDVDLSWQAWLNDYVVLHEPFAAITHFSGSRFYRHDLISREARYSFRNFLILAKKFFGDAGEQLALRYLNDAGDRNLAQLAIKEYSDHYRDLIRYSYEGRSHPCVKIVGLNCFHNTK
jgi:GT2 family glycosyltransferase